MVNFWGRCSIIPCWCFTWFGGTCSTTQKHSRAKEVVGGRAKREWVIGGYATRVQRISLEHWCNDGERETGNNFFCMTVCKWNRRARYFVLNRPCYISLKCRSSVLLRLNVKKGCLWQVSWLRPWKLRSLVWENKLLVLSCKGLVRKIPGWDRPILI